MIPLEAANIIVAGRPISATHEAHSSIRIMPITSCIGEAAGIAAFLAVKGCYNTKDVSIKEMQNILIRNNALI